ncbi:MAG: hypothetical protein JWN41_644, partial [Thermoleophilia bacterium]|nr:hypothetical protein [Thermoleophilia bacterium]
MAVSEAMLWSFSNYIRTGAACAVRP